MRDGRAPRGDPRRRAGSTHDAVIMIRALVFDVQGTLVEFHAPLMRLGADVSARKGLDLDWAVLARDWRGLYREAMDAINDGRRGFERVDVIYRRALDQLLDARGLGDAFSAAERDDINAVWTRLDPWPDTIPGLARLRQRFILATLSNAGMAALVSLVKHAGLPFDAILSAELAQAYKPAAAVYKLAVDYLGVPASEIMLVACHKYDLHAAKALGLQTAFVARPLEFGPAASPDCTPEPDFDINARDLLELADELGA